MKKTNYVDMNTFEDMRKNMRELISVLNHNMTKLSVDVSWLKRLSKYQIGFLAAIAAGVIIKLFI